MANKNKSKKTKGATDKDSQPPDIVFDEFITSVNALTSVILILDSDEEQLILKAFYHLDKFATKFVGNYRELYARKILPAIYKHMNSQHRFIRRFSMKILSQMFVVPRAKKELIANDLCYQGAMQTFTEINDNLLMEYSGIILNELLVDPARMDAILEHSTFFQVLFGRIPATNDPDVLHQSLKLMHNISKCENGLAKLCSFQEELPFSFLLTATKNDYTEIQLCALDVLQQLCKCTNLYVASRYKDALFLDDIFSILENYVWYDLHTKTIELLKCATKKPFVADKFYNDVYLDRYLTFVNTTRTHKLDSLAILVELANYPDARPILHDNDLSVMLIDFLKKGEMTNISEGIGLMSNHRPALELFLEENVIELMIDQLRDEDVPLGTKVKICSALAAVFKLSSIACRVAIDYDGVSTIADLLSRSVTAGDSTVDLKMQLVQMLISLARQQALRPVVMTKNMAKNLYFSLRENQKSVPFAIEMLKCMALYIADKTLQSELLTMDFCKIMIPCLSADSPFPLRTAATDFLLIAAQFPVLSDRFIDCKVLNCLLDDTDAIKNVPNWNEAIEKILSNNLSMKFAIRGALELEDITDDKFYATKKIWSNFRRLREILVNECAPRRPIFLCNFNHAPPTMSILSTVSVKSLNQSKDTMGAIVNRDLYNRRPFDKNLPKYLKIVQEAMQIAKLPSKLHRPADLKRCIEILAEFVSRKLCSEPYPTGRPDYSDAGSISSSLRSGWGPCPCSDDNDSIADEHLTKLKEDTYNCNIIPLGSVNYGSYFEKSLLFKVLADRIGLPCKLKMDPNNNANVWNEVAIPLYETPVTCGDLPNMKFIPPTHVVDLMERPGILYAIGCRRAQEYQRLNKNKETNV